MKKWSELYSNNNFEKAPKTFDEYNAKLDKMQKRYFKSMIIAFIFVAIFPILERLIYSSESFTSNGLIFAMILMVFVNVIFYIKRSNLRVMFEFNQNRNT